MDERGGGGVYISVFDIFHFDRETRAGISDTSAAEEGVEHGLEEARRFKHPPTRNIGAALGTSPRDAATHFSRLRFRSVIYGLSGIVG